MRFFLDFKPWWIRNWRLSGPQSWPPRKVRGYEGKPGTVGRAWSVKGKKRGSVKTTNQPTNEQTRNSTDKNSLPYVLRCASMRHPTQRFPPWPPFWSIDSSSIILLDSLNRRLLPSQVIAPAKELETVAIDTEQSMSANTPDQGAFRQQAFLQLPFSRSSMFSKKKKKKQIFAYFMFFPL